MAGKRRSSLYASSQVKQQHSLITLRSLPHKVRDSHVRQLHFNTSCSRLHSTTTSVLRTAHFYCVYQHCNNATFCVIARTSLAASQVAGLQCVFTVECKSPLNQSVGACSFGILQNNDEHTVWQPPSVDKGLRRDIEEEV